MPALSLPVSLEPKRVVEFMWLVLDGCLSPASVATRVTGTLGSIVMPSASGRNIGAGFVYVLCAA